MNPFTTALFMQMLTFCCVLGGELVVSTESKADRVFTTYARDGKVVFTTEVEPPEGDRPAVSFQKVWVGGQVVIATDDLLREPRRWIYPVAGVLVTELSIGPDQIIVEKDDLEYFEVFYVTPNGLLLPRDLDPVRKKKDLDAAEGGMKKGEPGATDNPDDAQRFREDH